MRFEAFVYHDGLTRSQVLPFKMMLEEILCILISSGSGFVPMVGFIHNSSREKQRFNRHYWVLIGLKAREDNDPQISDCVTLKLNTSCRTSPIKNQLPVEVKGYWPTTLLAAISTTWSILTPSFTLSHFHSKREAYSPS
jgi:hypothetical protein